MPSFPKPKFEFEYEAGIEIKRLRSYRDTKPGRLIPPKDKSRLLVASWNVANLGEQKRRDPDHELIAEIMRWFDLVAVQEIKENLGGLEGIRAHLPKAYKALYSDAAGNNERMAFLYDSRKVGVLEEVGEIALPVSEYPRVKLEGVEQEFKGFDRSPYFAAFQSGKFKFNLASVHLYFGKFKNKQEAKRSMDRRALETYAVATWAADRRRSKHTPIKDIIALGDFNLPKMEPDDPIYKALTRKGLLLPKHTSQVGSNLEGDMYYDQIGFFKEETVEFTGNINVFDFDGAVFPSLWDLDPKKFRSYVKYYLSDHRPIWCEFKID